MKRVNVTKSFTGDKQFSDSVCTYKSGFKINYDDKSSNSSSSGSQSSGLNFTLEKKVLETSSKSNSGDKKRHNSTSQIFKRLMNKRDNNERYLGSTSEKDSESPIEKDSKSSRETSSKFPSNSRDSKVYAGEYCSFSPPAYDYIADRCRVGIGSANNQLFLQSQAPITKPKPYKYSRKNLKSEF